MTAIECAHLALRYANGAKSLPPEAGECFRHGQPLAQMSTMQLESAFWRAWNLSDTEKLEEIRAEKARRES